jgi:hypothetical protein
MNTDMLWTTLVALGCAALLIGAMPAQAAGEIPDPKPPVYDQLKPLHLKTPLVKEGKAAATIVAADRYARPAKQLQASIKRLTGVELPLVADTAPAAAVPLTGQVIVLGNRSTNRTLGRLYDHGYTWVDVKFPGRGGYDLRSLHSPYGNGHNAVIVGGSDEAGVEQATAALERKLQAAGARPGELAVGWLLEVKLGEGLKLPAEAKDAELWEASGMYGSSGYFGWNIISKLMGLYYVSGDEKYLREMWRLSFPDPQAIAEIEALDGERIENKHDPLAGPYHYSAHMMILLWDLIEESPFFTAEQRLKITNAFSRQLNHRVPEGVYMMTTPRAYVGDRHGDWAAASLYALGRYFQKDYPGPIWQRSLQAADEYFTALERSAWMAGANDHLFWFTSYYDPIFNYMLMSDKQPGITNGNLEKALSTQQILSTGLEKDWGLNASSLSMLNKAAHITGDGRWLWYRQRTGLDTSGLRLGQSFWPGPELAPAEPTDQVGNWNIHWMPEPMWRTRNSDLPLEQSFRWGAFRSELGPGGDYLLLDGYNGAGRNPYHTYDVLELRLAGATVLKGYHNQVLCSADGMVEPLVAMDGALTHHAVVGQVAVAVGEVPRTPFATWRRTLAQRVGQYALFVDELAFRTDSENVQVETTWQMPGGAWDADSGALRSAAAGQAPLPAGWRVWEALKGPLTVGPGKPEDLLSRLESIRIGLLKAPAVGSWIEMPFTVDQPVAGELFVELLNFEDRGIVRLSLDGRVLGEDVDHYAPAVATSRVSLGWQTLTAGEHRVRVEVVGKRPEAKRHYVGLAGVCLRPEGVPEPSRSAVNELLPGDPLRVSGGAATTMVWRGPAQAGQARRFFTLLARNESGRRGTLACLRLADSAVALRLPEAAVACVGQYGGNQGELVVLSEATLYGHGLTRAGGGQPLLAADQPIAVDWRFEAGELAVVAGAQTVLRLALRSPEQLRLNGQPVRLTAVEGLVQLTLPAGTHQLTGAVPATPAWKPLTAELAALSEQARPLRAAAQAELQRPALPELPEIKPLVTARVAGSPVATALVPEGDRTLLAVGAGSAVHLLSPQGEAVRVLPTAGAVRVLHYWPEAELLLVGCADEKVIAFDRAGQRKWEFTSEMDPHVWELGKQYWFKSAHPGIYGLASGLFDDNQPRAFVGSACTVEILDLAGRLVKRLPVLWGPTRQFLLVEAAGGSRNLLSARWNNDGAHFVGISNQGFKLTGGGYIGVPEGHTEVRGWDSMNREDNVRTDLDGDGQVEIVSAINGTWNRVTIYSESGQPRYNAQFGPGEKAPRANLRMMEVADINGDGKQEIVVAVAQGLVVALDSQARRLWSRRLASPPTVVRWAGKALVVGCEDGSVVTLDGQGKPLSRGQITGRPVLAPVVTTPAGAQVWLVTASGQVAAFAP